VIIDCYNAALGVVGAQKRPGKAAGDKGKGDDTAALAADVKAKIKAKNAGGFKLGPLTIASSHILSGLTMTLGTLALVFVVYMTWPKSGYGHGRERVPDGMESITAHQRMPGVQLAKAFEYLRTPQTWVYWKADTTRVAGAVDRAAVSGMRFMEATSVEGNARDVTWLTTHAGTDATTSTKMRLSLTGKVKEVTNRGLRSKYLVASTSKNASAPEITVTHTLLFGHKGLTAEQRKAVRARHKGQMDQSLKVLQQRLS